MSLGYTDEQIADLTNYSKASIGKFVGRLYTALGIDTNEARNKRVIASRAYIARYGLPE